MWKHVAAPAFGAITLEINSMWSLYENALSSPGAAPTFGWKGLISFLMSTIR